MIDFLPKYKYIGAETVKLILKKICLIFAFYPMPMRCRKYILNLAGVKFSDISSRVDIGSNVLFDRVYPEKITIGKNVCIAANCVLLTHYVDPSSPSPPFHYKHGEIVIEDGCFIGANSIICNAVTIGSNSIVGAGSIVTKSIPPNETWAGNPAHKIGARGLR